MGHDPTVYPSSDPKPSLGTDNSSLEDLMAPIGSERRARGRFILVDSETMETLGIYFNDEGYSTMNLTSISAFFPDYIKQSLRITGVCWADYEEVVIYIKGKLKDKKSSSQKKGKIN